MLDDYKEVETDIEYSNKYFTNKSVIEIEYLSWNQDTKVFKSLESYYNKQNTKNNQIKFQIKETPIVNNISEWCVDKNVDFLICTTEIFQLDDFDDETIFIILNQIMAMVNGRVLVIIKNNGPLKYLQNYFDAFSSRRLQFVKWDNNFSFLTKVIEWIATGENIKLNY
jgi:hypothetical protein